MLTQATDIASSGLANVSAQLALLSQNIANAQTPGYAREIGTQNSGNQGALLMGVRTGLTQRVVDAMLQNATYEQSASVAGLGLQTSAQAAIDAVQGTPGAGTDLSSALATLTAGFTTLADDPSNQAQASAVVQDAGTLANQLNSLSTVVQQQRQTAQDSVVSDVATLNTALSTVGSLSDEIIAATATHTDTADLENQRDAAIAKITPLLDVQVTRVPNGDVQIIASGGLMLDTRARSGPFAAAAARTGPTVAYPGTLPAVTLSGADVTASLRSGRIGAALTLRDRTLPSYQAQLDEFAETLSTRFDAQGLRLFSRPDGTLPPTGGLPVQSGYLGYAGAISVNPAVTATPTRVRDGTGVIPPGSPASSAAIITKILDFALGAQAATGVPQPPPNAAGLGASGTLTLPYAAPSTLASFASSLVSAQAADSAQATSDQTTETGLQTSLTQRLSSQSAVSVDTELANMTVLQNAYGANAKVLTATQSLWSTLLAAVNVAAL